MRPSEDCAMAARGSGAAPFPIAQSAASRTARQARRAEKKKGEGRKRGMPDAAGRGLDHRPSRTFVGGVGSGLDVIGERRKRLHFHKILRNVGGFYGTIP